MNEHTLRQRRNLIVVSIMLILFDIAAVDIVKVGFAGTEFIVGRPAYLVVFVWVLWAYFLIRFFQHVRRDESENVIGEFYAFVNSAIAFEYGLRVQEQSGGPYNLRVKRRAAFDWIVECEWQSAESGGFGKPEIFNVEATKVAGLYLQSLWNSCAKSTQVTNFVLPYLLAFSAPIVYAQQSISRLGA